jgi:hypothetical protein
VEISKQCEGHGLFRFSIEKDFVKVTDGYRSSRFLDRGEERRILRAAPGYEHLAHGFGDESPVCVSHAFRR